MKWMITLLLTAVVNVVIIVMFVASKLGSIPLMLPLVIAGVTTIAFMCPVVSAVHGRQRESLSWLHHLMAAVPWAVATGFNLWAFQGVLC